MVRSRLAEITKDFRQMEYDDLRRFVGERAGRAAVLQARGEALRGRYDTSQAALQEIMDFVGFGPSKLDPETRVYTYGINLGKGENANGGMGTYVGYLSRKQYPEKGQPVYAFSAHFDRDDGLSSSRDTVVQEFSYYQDFEWAERSGWYEESLARARLAHEPLLDLAEETTAMLWNTIRDAELNPKLAVRLAAQEAREARGLSEPPQA